MGGVPTISRFFGISIAMQGRAKVRIDSLSATAFSTFASPTG
jgi:hypothetical protein